jgi:hypothetical protein
MSGQEVSTSTAAAPLPVTLESWKPIGKGALIGLATVIVGHTLRIVDAPVMAGKDGGVWAGMPRRQRVTAAGVAMRDASGKAQYESVIEWTSPAARARWSTAVTSAVKASIGDHALIGGPSP